MPKVEDRGASKAAEGGIGDTLTLGMGEKLKAWSAAEEETGGKYIPGGKDANGNYVPPHREGGSGGDFWEAFARHLDLENARTSSDEENHPYARAGGQVAGGALLPFEMERVGLNAGRQALRAGATMAEARAVATRALRARAALMAGGYGAAHGAGSGDTPMEVGIGALTEGALGAATGALTGPLAAGMRPTRSAPTEGQQVGAAAERLGMDVLPADVGGPTTRRATSVIAQTIAGGQPVISAARRVIEQGKVVRDRAASAIGTVADPEAAGQAAAAGAEKYMKTSRSRIGRIYDTAASLAGDVRLPLPKAISEVDDQIARLGEVPGGGVGLKEAEDLREALNGDFTVQGIRDMRTEMFVKPDFRGTPVERRMRRIVDAAAGDIEQGLRDAGKGDAANAFRMADKQWRERLSTIERVIEPIIGKADAPRSGEEIVAALQRAGKGNAIRLGKFIDTLPSEESGMVRATIINQMGRAGDGAQNAAGDAFSLAKFLTDYNKLTPSAKVTIFGAEGRAALDDLAIVASGTKAAQQYANHSNTGGVVGNLMTMGSATGGLPTFLTTIAAQYGLGRLLASPRVARWIARAPRTGLSGPAYIERLSRIARAEPAIANEVLQLQQRLTDAFASSPARLAADEAGNEPAVGNGQSGQQ
jgi:hypothetical protein